jgi:cyclopropane fatty-acyl-phospholipid synthase-like methyltransferase
MTSGSAAGAADYDRYYYEHYEGNPYERSPAWLARMGDIADHVVRTLKPDTALDAGCALGILVESLRTRGVAAEGVDVSEYAIAQIPEPTAEHCWQASLAEPLERRYDLIITIEVLEHIPEVELQQAIDNLCAATDRILFSSTPYHYEDPTHINIKQPEQWSIEFARRGFVRDVDYDASFIEPWSALYVREDLDVESLVARYDRNHWYQAREIQRTREGILELQQQLSRIESRVSGEGDLDGRIGRSLDAAEHDALTARDELIGLRRELGETRGRVAELEAELASSQYARIA